MRKWEKIYTINDLTLWKIKKGFNEENSAECMKYFYEIEAEYAIFMRILFPFLS